MQYVVAIHGGQSFSKHGDFLENLKTKKIDIIENRPSGWRKNLPEDLGPKYKVLLPQMPNSQNAHYNEWKIWLERYLELTKGPVTLIGHSQGAMFLARYLSENIPTVVIADVHLVAGAYEEVECEGEDGGNFMVEIDQVHTIVEHVQKIFIYHSEDDFVVPYNSAKILAKKIPTAEFISFKDRGHFLQDTFPEIIGNIKMQNKVNKMLD